MAIDTFETSGMRLSTGKIIYTDPLNADTDGDGLKDGEEIIPQFKFVDSSSIGLPGVSCGIYFKMLSNPNMSDSDGDGILDNEDTAPLEIGIGNDVIGEMTIVSYAEDGYNFANGHSFLIYKSYIDDTLDFSGFYSGYTTKCYDDNLYGFAEVEEVGDYSIKRNKYVTLGNAARHTNDVLEILFRSSSGSSDLLSRVEGGTWYNWEISKMIYDGEEYSLNCALTYSITKTQLKTILNYYREYNFYNVFTNNCTKVAAGAWNLAFNDNLATRGKFYYVYFHTPQVLKSSISDRARSYKIDISKIIGDVL